MKETRAYSASAYRRDGGVGLGWTFRYCCVRNANEDMQNELEEFHRQRKSQPGTVIGRPAGIEAYRGQSAMLYQQKSGNKKGQEGKNDQEPKIGPPSEP
jgi:hypothetical protein